MWKSFGETAVVAVLCMASVPHVMATGDYYSERYWLDEGSAIDRSPEFFWETELNRIALAYKPTEKSVLDAHTKGINIYDRGPVYADQAAKIDLDDFLDALKQGRLKPADPAAAEAQHKAARIAIQAANEVSTDALPAEAPSEFADYHIGAFAFHKGHTDDARKAWETLLQRPAAERHYRTVWAAFMLAKLAVYDKDKAAVSLLQKVRSLAAEGFADSLGLAADTYGWEAKCELEQGHLEQSAKLYLTQLSLGEDSAVVSLKAFIPDRGPNFGSMSFSADGQPLPPAQDYPSEPNPPPTPEAKHRMDAAARSPVLRSLVTAHVLATATAYDYYVDNAVGRFTRCLDWLKTLENAKIKQLDDADQLAWVAYTAGQYDAAKRWLALQKTDTSMSLWLQAKLARRAGKLEDATRLTAKALEAFKKEPARGPDDYNFSPNVHGDLAVLHLSHAKFSDALDEFIAGGHTEEKTYLVEQMFSADEVIAYLKKNYPWGPEQEAAYEAESKDPQINTGGTLRPMLARRLVREDRYQEARTYFHADQQKQLDQYTGLLARAENPKLPKMERARAWFDAANFVRDEGDAVMGYSSQSIERYRDSTPVPGGSQKDKISQRNLQDVTDATPDKSAFTPFVTTDEKKRIAKYKAPVFKVGFTRHVASVLIWKSSALLPDNSDELADVLNTGGNWLKGDYRGDDDAADKFFQAIERRASKTALGKEAGAKHWFIDQYGPWSTEPK